MQEEDIISYKVEVFGLRRAKMETIVPAGAVTETIMLGRDAGDNIGLAEQ